MSEGAPRKSPAALTAADMARLLRASGSKHASEHAVRADVDAGAPTNADGTMNMVHYAAWLARQVTAQEASRGH